VREAHLAKTRLPAKKDGPRSGPPFGKSKKFLSFGNRDGAGRADLDAALAAQALIFIRHTRLVILHLKDADGANVNAFFVPGAFIGIHFNSKTH
jgi:hypothetical protein